MFGFISYNEFRDAIQANKEYIARLHKRIDILETDVAKLKIDFYRIVSAKITTPTTDLRAPVKGAELLSETFARTKTKVSKKPAKPIKKKSKTTGGR